MALASGCASCVFGAVASRTLTFSYDTVVAATVTVIPHVTVYPDGSQSTSWETDRQSLTEIVGSASSQGVVETFSNINSITWTVDGATLTWPTSYVQYLGFKGAALTADNNVLCANGADATSVTLPSSVDPASLIYPITNAATGSMPLPTPLLEYLDQLDLVASQFDGEALTGCAPLDSSSLVARHEMDRRKKFEGARRDIYPEARAASPAFTQANSTSHAISSSTVLSVSPQSISSSQGPSSTSNMITSTSQVPSSSQSSIPISFSASLPPVNSTFSSNGTCNSMNGTCGTLSPGRFTQHRRPGFPVPPGSSAVPAPPPEPPGTNGPIYTHKSAVGLTTKTLPPIITTAKPTKGNPTPKQTKHPSNPNNPPKNPAPGNHHTSKGSSPHHGGVPGLPSIIGNHHTAKDPKGRTKIFTVGKSTYTQKPGGVVIGSRTVHPGQKITIGHGASPTTFAVHTRNGHTHLVVDGTTYKPTQMTRDPPTASPGIVITTKGHTLTILRSGSSVIVKDRHSKTTIPLGKPITFGGQTISAPRHGDSTIIVNGTPKPLQIAPEAIITAGKHTITALAESKSIVLADGTSTAPLKDGSIITFEGQTISAARNGSVIVVNGKTVHFTTAAINSTRSGHEESRHSTHDPNRAARITAAAGRAKADSSDAAAVRGGLLGGAVERSCAVLGVIFVVLAVL